VEQFSQQMEVAISPPLSLAIAVLLIALKREANIIRTDIVLRMFEQRSFGSIVSTETRARLGLDLSATKVILRPAVECAELHSLYFLFPNQICLAIPDGFDHCIRGKTESVHRHSREHVIQPTMRTINSQSCLDAATPSTRFLSVALPY
jgi:hypothetical protein